MEKFEKNEKTSYSGFTLFLTGIALGAVAGVLFAPRKGEETRKQLGDWLKEKREKSREALAERREQVAAAIEAGKKAYQEKSDKKELLSV